MFSGIVEAVISLTKVCEEPEGLRLVFDKPSDFDDLSIGDSVCVDGVCLTVEKFSDCEMEFVAAAETLQVTGWKPDWLLSHAFNAERSLKMGERIHGHLVTGHVDAVVELCQRQEMGDSLILQFSLSEELLPFVWKKGCIAINGVSLTVNQVEGQNFDVCVVPETFRKTNLAKVNVGEKVNIEADYLAKSFISSRRVSLESQL